MAGSILRTAVLVCALLLVRCSDAGAEDIHPLDGIKNFATVFPHYKELCRILTDAGVEEDYYVCVAKRVVRFRNRAYRMKRRSVMYP